MLILLKINLGFLMENEPLSIKFEFMDEIFRVMEWLETPFLLIDDKREQIKVFV